MYGVRLSSGRGMKISLDSIPFTCRLTERGSKKKVTKKMTIIEKMAVNPRYSFLKHNRYTNEIIYIGWTK